MGGLDIYWAQKKNGNWNIKNLRYPLNSGGDDFGITVRDRDQVNKEGYVTGMGYFSSSRPGGKGSDDIYRFTLEKPLFFKLDVIVYKKVYRQDTSGKELEREFRLPEAQVKLEYKNQEGDTSEQIHFTSDSGTTRFDLFPKTDFKLIARKEGFFTRTKKISTKGYEGTDKMTVNLQAELVMDTIVEEKEIVIQNIYYDYDKANIREDATDPLDTLAALLKDNPNLKVELASHTAARGDDEYNMKLSQRRAQSVVDYLVSKGVSGERLIAKGYGETQLLNKCDDGVDCPEEKHQRNRRTTFKVVGIDREFESISPEQIQVDTADYLQPDTSKVEPMRQRPQPVKDTLPSDTARSQPQKPPE
jgi:outer membrane protein OmpA-like peptidoglycan-associated protein